MRTGIRLRVAAGMLTLLFAGAMVGCAAKQDDSSVMRIEAAASKAEAAANKAEAAAKSAADAAQRAEAAANKAEALFAKSVRK